MKVVWSGGAGLLIAWILLLTFPPLAIAGFAGAIAGLVVAYGRMFIERRFWHVR
jgi:hypothetical protein